MLKRLRVVLLIVCFVITSIMSSFVMPAKVYAYSINNNTTNKTVTMAGSRYSMVFNYNNKAVITSLMVDNKETMESGQGIYSAVMINNSWITSQGLTMSPIVSVSGNVVTATFSTTAASEIWTFTVSDTNVQFQLSRTYNAAYAVQQQGTPMLNFKQDIFESVRWTDCGSNWWIGGAASVLKYGMSAGTGYSADKNVRRGMEDINYTLLSTQADSFALKVGGTTNRDSLSRGRATEVDRCDTGTTRFLRFYTTVAHTGTNLTYASGNVAGKPDGWPGNDGSGSGWFVGHIRYTQNKTGNGAVKIYGDVNVSSGETVQTTLTFSPDTYSNYFRMGTLNGVDQNKLAHALNDYGRMMIMDKKYGCTIEYPTYAFELPALEQHWVVNLLGVMGDPNALESGKNGLNTIRDWIQTTDGHVCTPYPPGNQNNPSGWGYYYPDMQWGYVIAIANLYALNGDLSWLNSMKTSAEKALDYGIGAYCNSTTYLVTNPYTNDPQLTGSGNDYWEKSYGTYNGYLSAMLYEALVKWAELERNVLGDTAKASGFEAKASILKTNYNNTLWSNSTNTVLYGTGSQDVRYVPAQGAALRSGILSKDRIAQVVASVERDQRNFNLGFHVTTVRDLRNAAIPAPQDDGYTSIMVGENGGWYGAPDADYYAGLPVYGDRNKIPFYINKFTYYFDQTHFLNGTTWKRDGVTRADAATGDSWSSFPSHVAPIWALYTYSYGFQPKYDRLVLAPFINDEMVGSVVNYNWRGQDIQTTYTSKYNFSITAASLPTSIQVRFINQTPAKSYIVKVDGSNQNITADAEGNVNITMSAAGTHTYELVNYDPETIFSSANNIASGKPTFASSVNNGDTSTSQWPETATDGNTAAGGWVSSGGVFPSWIGVDLGKKYPLGKVKMTFVASETYKYKVEGTNNLINGSWTTLVDRTAADVAGSPASPITENINGIYQYVRVYFTGTVSGNWANMRELEVYPQGTATCSSNGGGHEATMALDGNDTTYWCSSNGTFPQWLKLDMGSNRNLGIVKTKFYANELWKYKIEGSTNDSTWTTLVDYMGSGVTAQDMFDRVSGSYRYVRITVTGSGGDWAAIREFNVYGN